MSEAFFGLSDTDRRDALGAASEACARPVHLLEKDIWVVWALETLYQAPFGKHLIFKGGTSLSKAYGVIRRFSEDVDLTYDIRAIAPDLVGTGEALPTSRSQQKRWSDKIRSRLVAWVAEIVAPLLVKSLSAVRWDANIQVEQDKIHIHYGPLSTGTGYVRPAVLLEFGARSTGEPWETRQIACDVAPHLPDLQFPEAIAQVMRLERTFWEKATAIHVFCLQGRLRERFARHWHDLVRLDDAGAADTAIAAREIAARVATHKAMFFFEKDRENNTIDYEAAVKGGLKLVPEGDALKALSDDYTRMVEDGLLLEEAETFDSLVARCQTIQDRANRPR